MKAYHTARKEAMSKLSFLGPAPANIHFALNERHDAAAAATEPTMVTWDFSTTLLKGPVNQEIAASILQRVLQVGDPERSSEAIKERVRTYFETLKRNFARIVAGAMDTENRMRSRARRIARVSQLKYIIISRADNSLLTHSSLLSLLSFCSDCFSETGPTGSSTPLGQEAGRGRLLKIRRSHRC
jgi:hypothetical protein